jgi:hypothetical protein
VHPSGPCPTPQRRANSVVSDGDTATRPSQRRRCSRSPRRRSPHLKRAASEPGSLGQLAGTVLGSIRRGRSVRRTRVTRRYASCSTACALAYVCGQLARPRASAVTAPRARLVLLGSNNAGLNKPAGKRASEPRPRETAVLARPEQHSITGLAALSAENISPTARWALVTRHRPPPSRRRRSANAAAARAVPMSCSPPQVAVRGGWKS